MMETLHLPDSRSPYIAPQLVLRVGVTGHRPKRLVGTDLEQLTRTAKDVLHHLASIARRLQAENDAEKAGEAPFQQGVAPTLRLATSIAAGADSFVAEAARMEGYALNLILPFPDGRYLQDFSSDELETYERLSDLEPEGTTRTELNLGEGSQPHNCYLAAGHLMLAHTDVLLAVWDGEESRGVGGTAEIVAEAQRRGLIVVWLHTTGGLALSNGAKATEQETRCLVPERDGTVPSRSEKDALWDRYYTAAPRQRTPSEQQYSDRKLRSRNSRRNTT